MSMNINSKNQHAVSTLPSTGTLGQIVYLISDNSFYGWDANTNVWEKLTNDGGGVVDLSGYQLKSEKDQANGYAGLDSSSKIATTTIATDTNNRFVTDSEKTTWNAKQSALGFTLENTANKNTENGYVRLNSSTKTAIKRYGTNNDNIPEEYFKELLLLQDNEDIPADFELSSEQDVENLNNLYANAVQQIQINKMQQIDNSLTFKMSNAFFIDTEKDYNILGYIKKDLGLIDNMLVKEYYASYSKDTGNYNDLIIREEKEYQKLNNSPLFNLEILRIKYYSKLNEVFYTKIVETPLSLGYQMSITARMQELKIIKAEEYIISELGYETGLPLHIQLINEIKSYERMIVQPLYDAIQALSALTQDQKNIVNAILFG